MVNSQIEVMQNVFNQSSSKLRNETIFFISDLKIKRNILRDKIKEVQEHNGINKRQELNLSLVWEDLNMAYFRAKDKFSKLTG